MEDGMTMDTIVDTITMVSGKRGQFKCLRVIEDQSTIHDLNSNGDISQQIGKVNRSEREESEGIIKNGGKVEDPKSHLCGNEVEGRNPSFQKGEMGMKSRRKFQEGNGDKVRHNNNNIHETFTAEGREPAADMESEQGEEMLPGGEGMLLVAPEGSYRSKEVYVAEEDSTQGIHVERNQESQGGKGNGCGCCCCSGGQEEEEEKVTRISTLVSTSSRSYNQIARREQEEPKEERNQSGDEEEEEPDEKEEEEEAEERIWMIQSRCGSRFVRRSITSIESDPEKGEEAKEGELEYFLGEEEEENVTEYRQNRKGVEGEEADEDWYVKGEDGEWIKEEDNEEEEEEEERRKESLDLIPGLPPLGHFEYERTLSSDSWTSSASTSSSTRSSCCCCTERTGSFDSEDGEVNLCRRMAVRKSSLLTEERKKEKREENRRLKRRRRSRAISWGTAETVEFIPFPREVVEMDVRKVSGIKEPSRAWFLSLGFFFTGGLICYRFYSSHFHLLLFGLETDSNHNSYQF